MNIERYGPDVEAAIAELDREDVVGRIWRRDHTVWKPDPKEITDRLGWLTVTDSMREQLPTLEAFADDVRTEGYLDVVLLGMGGSSLGPEALRRVLGGADGFPGLTVLDSTIPARVREVGDSIDPARALFLVSSKSGSTIEPNTLYRHFRELVEHSIGEDRAGGSFVAITDPGTVLEDLAHRDGFRRVFSNPPDLGGRYSVLSYFGLVPAALIGVRLAELLDRADRMRESCASHVPVRENPGAQLGAVMATLAGAGRDKLTVVTSVSIESFGIWVEQLIAESTGKEGKGIVPVAGEPLLEPEHYGDDRLFVYLCVRADDNEATDAAVSRIERSGQPVVRLDLQDCYDLGGEFYRWEFATAVAGAVLGIQPFDQPNVQQAKDMTDRVLDEYKKTGALPTTGPDSSLADVLREVTPGSYLGIMPYLLETPEVDRALAAIRAAVGRRHHIATTLGYGPRFLHSTGQLHKGGPDNGIFLQLVSAEEEDIPIPEAPYGFSALAGAQALGDLQALRAAGRRVASVQVGPNAASDIENLATLVA